MKARSVSRGQHSGGEARRKRVLDAPSLLSAVKWRAVGAQAAREVSNREIHTPVVSTYRWWARRPHSVMGALLEAATEHYGPQLMVSDPFSGGGTVTFEAARRGLRVYAQDLYPWPSRGLATALSNCSPETLHQAKARVLHALQPLRSRYVTPTGAELSHVLRVRLMHCGICEQSVYAYPHQLVSVTSRNASDQKAYFGCRHCGHLTLRCRDAQSFTCEGCGVRHRHCSDYNGCPHCKHELLAPLGWQAVLVQEIEQGRGQPRTRLRPVRADDPVAFTIGTDSHQALRTPILPGIETKRLLDAGFETWGDLYTSRQADVIVQGLALINQGTESASIKDRLAFSILGAAEMPAFLSRWDRFHLKPFESMANHRYSQTLLSVESNLLSPVGRGTIPRRRG